MNTAFVLAILGGLKTTLPITVCAMFFGMLVAALTVALQSVSIWLKWLFQCWHTFIRGLPDILIIFAANYGIQLAVSSIIPGASVTPFISGSIALSVIVAAYGSQIIIAAFHAIPKGQLQSAKVLNISTWTCFKKITLPQLTKHALPALINLSLVVLKDSSIISLIGLHDVMNAAHIAASETFSPFTYYSVAAVIYLIFSWAIGHLEKYVSNKLNKGDDNVLAYHG